MSVVVNYIDSIINLLVPDKRKDNTIAFLSPTGNEIQKQNDNLFNIFASGESQPDYVFFTFYSKNDKVKYGGQIYYSLTDENVANFPYEGSEFWMLITNNFIGVNQRQYFNGTKLVFEYAVNTYFNTVYQPNTTLNSEIYLETLTPKLKPFTIGLTEVVSDSILKTDSTGYIRQTDDNYDDTNLIIWVKDMGTGSKPTHDQVKNFANKYIVAGVHFSVSGY